MQVKFDIARLLRKNELIQEMEGDVEREEMEID